MTDKLTDQVKEDLLKSVPMNRLGEPSEIADLIIFSVIRYVKIYYRTSR
jgi:NAD(P)-dependent dehydrogenase (short-subunit alcohol dehydrogenase family)